MPILVLFLCLFITHVASFVLSSWLIRIEYESHRDSWIADDQPADYFGSLPGKHVSRMAVGVVWLYSTPEWMKRDPKTLRISPLIGCCSCVGSPALLRCSCSRRHTAS